MRDHVLEFIIPTFLIARHVSSDTSLIIGSSKTVFAASVLHTSVVAGHCRSLVGTQPRHQPTTTDICKPEAANIVCELLMMSDVPLETFWAIRNVGIINSNTWSHLVGYFYMIYTTMNGFMNIKILKYFIPKFKVLASIYYSFISSSETMGCEQKNNFL